MEFMFEDFGKVEEIAEEKVTQQLMPNKMSLTLTLTLNLIIGDAAAQEYQG